MDSTTSRSVSILYLDPIVALDLAIRALRWIYFLDPPRGLGHGLKGALSSLLYRGGQGDDQRGCTRHIAIYHTIKV